MRVDSVPFGEMDVDHVLISDAGVFAVETKFTASEWSESSAALRRAAADAQWKSRKIKFLLSSAGRPSVTPVVIIWGPGAPVLPDGYLTVDGVLVCRGSSVKTWKAYLEDLPAVLDPESLPAMLEFVRDHIRRTEQAHHRVRIA